MNHRRIYSISSLIIVGLVALSTLSYAGIPDRFKIDGVPRIKQLPNYCGPAALTSVLKYEGLDTTQQIVGKATYDPSLGATNGADLLLYARDKGFDAYSWNSSVDDVKKKIAAGWPVLVLQENSLMDTSGHFRVLTGYDDTKHEFYVVDPYYDNITDMSYDMCSKLWRRMGNWALVVIPKDKDTFKTELSTNNPVTHLDLSYGLYKRKDYDCALKEADRALALRPGDRYTMSLVAKIRQTGDVGQHVSPPQGS